MLCFERKRSTRARDVDLYLSRQFCLNEFMIYALVYACKYDLQITATDTVVLLLFYSGFEGKGCGWMDGGINSLMKLFIYLFILYMSVVHYVASVPFSHKMLPKHRNQCETIFRRKGSLCKFGL